MNDKSYIDWTSMSDVALAQSIGEFIKYHRLDQNRTQKEIADAAGISRSTLSLLERGESVTIATFLQVLRVLDLLPVMDVFKISHEISPIEYAKLQEKKRRRSRSKRKSKDQNEEPGW